MGICARRQGRSRRVLAGLMRRALRGERLPPSRRRLGTRSMGNLFSRWVYETFRAGARRRNRRAALRRELFRPSIGFEDLECRIVLSVTLSISNPVPITEGDSGTTNMAFVITRSGDSTG